MNNNYTNMKRVLFMISLIVFILNSVEAQNSLFGTVTDSEGNSIAYANLVIYRGSEFVSGTTSGIDGNFKLPVSDKLIDGTCFLVASFVGMINDTVRISNLKLTDGLSIILQPDANLLDEISIMAHKNPITIKGNMLVANVEHSVLSGMGSLDNLMNKIPFVTSENCEISIFGRGSAVVYLNNRKVCDVNILKQLKPQQIKKVEVVTNPDSKYGSDVNSVVKIYTIDNPEGLGSFLYMNVGLLPKLQENFFASVIYVKAKWEVSANINIGNGFLKEDGNDTDVIRNSNSYKYEKYHNDYDYKMLSGQVGLNYSISDKSNLGFKLWSYNFNYTNDYSMNMQHFVNDVVDFDEYTSSPINTKPSQVYSELYYTLMFGNTTAEFSNIYMNGDNKVENAYSESLVNVDTRSVSDYCINSSLLDFGTIFTEHFSISYGAEFTYTDNLQTFSYSENNISTDMYSNETTLNQVLNGEYLDCHFSASKFVFDLGGRFEFASFTYKDSKNQNGENVVRHYSDFLPNINIGYRPIDKFNFSIGYRESSQRPGYQDLNSNFKFMNRYRYSQGNPALTPFYKRSINAMAALYDFRIISSFDINRDKIFTEYLCEDDFVVLERKSNMPDFNELSIGTQWSKDFKIYSPSVEIDYSKQYLEGVYLDDICDYKKPAWCFRLDNSFKLPYQIMLNLSMDYSSRSHSIFEYRHETWGTNIILSKSFRSGLQLTFSAQNLFVPDKQVSCLRYKDLYHEEIVHRQKRITLDFSYNINSKNEKFSNRNTSKEFNRI